MNQMFFWIGFFELVTLPAIFETINGSGRAPGDFMFDPLGLGKGSGRARMELAEIKNGRLAMIAIGGIVRPPTASTFPTKNGASQPTTKPLRMPSNAQGVWTLPCFLSSSRTVHSRTNALPRKWRGG